MAEQIMDIPIDLEVSPETTKEIITEELLSKEELFLEFETLSLQYEKENDEVMKEVKGLQVSIEETEEAHLGLFHVKGNIDLIPSEEERTTSGINEIKEVSSKIKKEIAALKKEKENLENKVKMNLQRESIFKTLKKRLNSQEQEDFVLEVSNKALKDLNQDLTLNSFLQKEKGVLRSLYGKFYANIKSEIALRAKKEALKDYWIQNNVQNFSEDEFIEAVLNKKQTQTEEIGKAQKSLNELLTHKLVKKYFEEEEEEYRKAWALEQQGNNISLVRDIDTLSTVKNGLDLSENEEYLVSIKERQKDLKGFDKNGFSDIELGMAGEALIKEGRVETIYKGAHEIMNGDNMIVKERTLECADGRERHGVLLMTCDGMGEEYPAAIVSNQINENGDLLDLSSTEGKKIKPYPYHEYEKRFTTAQKQFPRKFVSEQIIFSYSEMGENYIEGLLAYNAFISFTAEDGNTYVLDVFEGTSHKLNKDNTLEEALPPGYDTPPRLTEIPATGNPSPKWKTKVNRGDNRVKIPQGASLFFATDGIKEFSTMKDEGYGKKRLVKSLAKAKDSNLEASDTRQELWNDLWDYRENEKQGMGQIDDISAVFVDFN